MPNDTKLIPVLAAATLVSACGLFASSEAPQTPRKETIHAVTADNRLLRFNAGTPSKIESTQPLQGLQPGETLAGTDYRVARGQLFAVGTSGRLYRVDAKSAQATVVGGPIAGLTVANDVAFDFNPTVDRIRFASGTRNLRLHPDTGAQVDGNPNADGLQDDTPLFYAAGDRSAGGTPNVVAAAYTYNKQNEKITTNYAIDARHGTLVTQGTLEGAAPAISPNAGRLFTVGPLRVGPFERASFDIADVSGAAFAAITPAGERRSLWYTISLETGAATYIGRVGGGEDLRGIAVEP
jgi:hypothetical protein